MGHNLNSQFTQVSNISAEAALWGPVSIRMMPVDI